MMPYIGWLSTIKPGLHSCHPTIGGVVVRGGGIEQKGKRTHGLCGDCGGGYKRDKW